MSPREEGARDRSGEKAERGKGSACDYWVGADPDSGPVRQYTIEEGCMRRYW